MGNSCVQSQNSMVPQSTIQMEKEPQQQKIPNKQQPSAQYIYHLEENLDDFSEPFYSLQYCDLDDAAKIQDNKGSFQLATVQTFDVFASSGFQTLGEQSFSQDTFQQIKKITAEETSKRIGLKYRNQSQNNIQLKQQTTKGVQGILKNEYCKTIQQSNYSSSSSISSTSLKQRASFKNIKNSQIKH